MQRKSPPPKVGSRFSLEEISQYLRLEVNVVVIQGHAYSRTLYDQSPLARSHANRIKSDNHLKAYYRCDSVLPAGIQQN